jgi:drug/metabolite transporter (DMT)-like permease
VTAVAAALILHEHTPARRWIGFSFGLFGILLINGGWRLDLHAAGLAANALFLLSFGCEAGFSVIGKPVLARAGILKIITLGLAAGSAANLLWDGPAAWSRLPTLTPESWVILLYLSVICTVVGYSAWYFAIRDADISFAALTILLQPPFGIAIAALWLRESLHWGQLWGTLAVVLGLCIGLRHRAAPEPALPARLEGDPA